ncbi:MAG: PCMD domain-containing protein [Bacteroidales bacterium]|nr:PCMD domain-containing protein [Bacteroidales bacterium]
MALAQLPDVSTTTEWTGFSVDFVYRQNVDKAKLKTGGYNLAVVCSSSTNGAFFMGAVGSTLWIDKLTVVCE